MTAYVLRSSDWRSDVCSAELGRRRCFVASDDQRRQVGARVAHQRGMADAGACRECRAAGVGPRRAVHRAGDRTLCGRGGLASSSSNPLALSLSKGRPSCSRRKGRCFEKLVIRSPPLCAPLVRIDRRPRASPAATAVPSGPRRGRSEENTSELQSLMRISYAVFCLKKKKHKTSYEK